MANTPHGYLWNRVAFDATLHTSLVLRVLGVGMWASTPLWSL